LAYYAAIVSGGTAAQKWMAGRSKYNIPRLIVYFITVAMSIGFAMAVLELAVIKFHLR